MVRYPWVGYAVKDLSCEYCTLTALLLDSGNHIDISHRRYVPKLQSVADEKYRVTLSHNIRLQTVSNFVLGLLLKKHRFADSGLVYKQTP